MPLKMIIDTDPGVDDALAIFMAMNSSEVEVLGLTTTFGNCPVAMSTANALHLLELCGRADIPVAQARVLLPNAACAAHALHQGAIGPLRGGHNERVADYVHGSDGLGNTGAASPKHSPSGKSAAQFIVDTLNEHPPGSVTLLALASLTNVALALHLDPTIASKLGGLVFLGGAYFVMGNVNPATEANIWHDPEAADWVLGSFPDGVVRCVGLDVTTRTIMSGADLDGMRDAGGRFCSYAWSISQYYKAYHVRTMGMDGIFLHDPTAFVAAIMPELFTWTEGSVRVAVEGCARGKTLLDTGAKNWVCENSWQTRPKCRVALEVDVAGVLAQVCARLSR